jgi:hypothetical protein
MLCSVSALTLPASEGVLWDILVGLDGLRVCVALGVEIANV